MVNKCSLLLFSLLIAFIPLVAQQNIAELKKTILTSDNEKKAEALLKLAEIYIDINPDSAIYYSQEAIKVAEQSSLTEKQAKAYRLYGKLQYYNGETTIAENYYIKSIESFASLKKLKEIVVSLLDLGELYQSLGQKPDAIKNYKQALKIAIENKFTALELKSYSYLADVYGFSGEYEESLIYFDKALQIAISTNDSLNIAKLELNIGIVFYFTQDYTQALQFYRRALITAIALDNKKGISLCYGNIGNVFEMTNQYDSAIIYHKNALKIQKEANIKEDINMTLINIGSANMKLGKYQEAESYYRQSISISEEFHDNYTKMIALKHLGENYLFLKQYSMAYKYFVESLNISIEQNNKELEKEILFLLSEYGSRIGDDKLALEYYKKYSIVKDTIQSLENQKSLASFKTKYETEKIETENRQLKNEAQIKDLTLQRRQIMLFAFITIAVLVIILTVFQYNRIRSKNKTNKLLSDKNHQLEILNATKDKFFSIISHDLKNPLSAFRNIAKSLENTVDNIDKDELKYFISKLSSSSSKLYDLLGNLLQWALTQTRRMECKLQSVNVSEAMKNTVSLLELNAQEKNIEILVQIDGKIHAIADKEMLQVVLRNLISNAIKFTSENGKVEITSELAEKEVIVEIKDNGIGMSEKDLNKLFRINIDTKTIGSSPEKGTGLGLIICKEMLDKCNGKILVESEPGKGTSFKFSLSKSD